MDPNYLSNTLYPPRKGAEVASAGEPEEHAAICGHLCPPEPHLRLLDHVSLRFLQSATWSQPSRPFRPQEDRGTGTFLPHPDTGAGLPVGSAPPAALPCQGAWVSRAQCRPLPEPTGEAIKTTQAARVC